MSKHRCQSTQSLRIRRRDGCKSWRQPQPTATTTPFPLTPGGPYTCPFMPVCMQQAVVESSHDSGKDARAHQQQLLSAAWRQNVSLTRWAPPHPWSVQAICVVSLTRWAPPHPCSVRAICVVDGPGGRELLGFPATDSLTATHPAFLVRLSLWLHYVTHTSEHCSSLTTQSG